MIDHHKIRKKKIEHWMKISALLVCYDAFVIAASYMLALLLRFDFHFSEIPANYLHEYYDTILPYICICIFVFSVFHLYNSLWRFASFRELYLLILATIIVLLIHIAGTWIVMGLMPASYYVFGIVVQFVLTLGVRFSYRFILLLHSRNGQETGRKKVLIIGAGEAAKSLARDIQVARETSEELTGFIDDNPNKWGRYIDGVKVLGGRDRILETAKEKEIEKIYFAIPSATAQEKRDILEICKDTGCELRNLPGTFQLRNGQVTVSEMKEVNVLDLLGREPVEINTEEIYRFIEGKVVLVTGGGGSIGSELCRQVAAHNPKQLVIFDIYENTTYETQLQLKKEYPELDLQVIIGSVRDSRKIWQVMETYHPDIVYHAAAHKHVPLMEDSPCEAVKNNVIGTYKTAYAAVVYHVSRFVLISTDKAVNPTNIMGASKRVCEMIIQAFNEKVKTGNADELPQLFTHTHPLKAEEEQFVKEQLKSAQTEFVAVRFGNVLDSHGSVIPLFKRQIAEGGPVTVTHPDIIRYFMTIPEAVSLVMEAGTYAHGGEIFVLDMGEPVKIDTMARNLIKLSGHTPDGDIKIVYTGLRPGEKLYEEKLMAEEGLQQTPNNLIHVGIPIPFDKDDLLEQLWELLDESYKNKEDIRELMKSVVNTYHPA